MIISLFCTFPIAKEDNVSPSIVLTQSFVVFFSLHLGTLSSESVFLPKLRVMRSSSYIFKILRGCYSYSLLSQNQNRYIQRDLCLAYSELATAIEAIIVHCHKAVVPWGSESCRPREGSTCSSREFFLLPLWVALLKNQEFTPKWYFSGIISNFQQLFLREFPRYPANHSFLVQVALNGLFQETSGAWIYLVDPSGTIT